jgi:hypothetical protein
LVLFQWDSLDHVPVSASEVPPPPTGQPYDYFHINSVKEDADGNLVLSARNTWAAYKVSRRSAHVMWTLGGKHSTFKLPRGGTFAFQHDVRVLDASDSRVTLFDDGAGPPTVHKQSRGLSLSLSTKSRTATVTGQYLHSPPLSADFEGNVQTLANGDAFLGWGQQPYFTELNPSGQIVFDGRFLDANTSYRAYRFEWAGTPVTSPKIAVTHSGSTATVYASWNGATGVASWRVLEGTSASSLHQVSSANRAGFETQLSVAAAPFVAVQAVDSSGKVIGTSATTAGQ